MKVTLRMGVEMMEKIIAEFFKEMERIGRSQCTIAGYKNDISQFEKYCGDRLTTETFRLLARDFLAAHSNQSPRTVRRKYAALRSLAKFGNLNFDNIGLPKIPKRLPKSLRQHEIEKLFALLRKDRKSHNYLRDLAIFELLYCGLRNAELRRLTHESFDFPAKIVKVIGKGDKEVIYNLSDAAVDATKEYIERRRTQQLFNLTGGGLIFMVANRSQRYIGKRITPHTLRHSMAMHVLLAGADIRMVQKMLNHSSIATTQIYTEAYDDVVAKAFNTCHPHN